MTNWKKRLSLVLCIVLLLCQLPLAASASSDFPTVLAEAKKGVVQIYGLGDDGFFLHSWIGTGFAVGEKGQPSNVFLTNWHVVTGDGDFTLDKVKIWILQENCQIDERTGEPDPNKSISCEVLKTTTGYPDYAIIRATEPVTDYYPLTLMSSKDILDGTKVYSLGYPAIIGSISASHYGIDDITSTDGIISQHMQYADADNTWVLMHTAQISGGNSGGPLITEQGLVVGLNTYGFGESEASLNRYCAVYIDYAIDGLNELNLPYALAGASAPEAVPEAPEVPGTEAAADDATESEQETAENESDEETEDDEDKKKMIIIIAAAAGGVTVITLIIVIILVNKKKKEEEERRRLEIQRHYQAEQQRRQEEERRRIEEERRRMEAQRKEAQLRKEQEVKAQVQLVGGPVYPVRASGCVIGRDRDCNIILPENTSGVSRHHCKLEHRGGQLILVDLNSTYGTYIHGKRIPANTPVALHPGSRFALGSEKCTFTVC